MQQGIVGFTQGQTLHLNASRGETLLFNKAISSIGSNFNQNKEFVCQTPGLYVFSFYGLTRSDSEIWLELMKNEELVASIYGYTRK